MKKIDIQNAPISAGSNYPEPFAIPCLDKVRYRLAIAAGLKKLGVNLLELNPGAWSSQRHWHTHTDEFIYVIEGEVVLVTQGSEEVLRAGDCAGFPEGEANGHHLQNRTKCEPWSLKSARRGSQMTRPTTRTSTCMRPRPDTPTRAARHTEAGCG